MPASRAPVSRRRDGPRSALRAGGRSGRTGGRPGLGAGLLVLFFLVLLGSGAGWVWRDRAARAREAEQERVARAAERANHLERAMERAELLRREGKRGEALAALERAQLLAREAEPAPPLAERIESLQLLLDAEGRDEVFVAQFEAIRREVQTEVDVEKNVSSSKKGYPKIREALEHYGIALGLKVSDLLLDLRDGDIRLVKTLAMMADGFRGRNGNRVDSVRVDPC